MATLDSPASSLPDPPRPEPSRVTAPVAGGRSTAARTSPASETLGTGGNAPSAEVAGNPSPGHAFSSSLPPSSSLHFNSLSRGVSDEELRQVVAIPEYLRLAVAAAVRSKEVAPPSAEQRRAAAAAAATAPQCPIIVMINARSGGRLGPALQSRLVDFLTAEQVYDLQETSPADFICYGLGCIEKFAEANDQCARETRDRIRILVAGGDGTVGWVLGELSVQKWKPVPPVGIIPLGTGNDLARSFGWGGSFSYAWRSAVKKYLIKAAGSKIRCLDSWQVSVKMATSVNIEFPHALRPQQQARVLETEQEDDTDNINLPDASLKETESQGVFYNYFSIGMDAQVAYGFHQLRNKAPYLARGPISNKLIYSGYSLSQGWFCTSCSANPRFRSLRNILRMHIIKKGKSDWEPFELPPKVRAVVVLNLQSYASGRNPWGHLDSEYNEKRGFVEPQADDGLLEVIGLFDGWHAACVMVNLCKAKHLVQASALRLEIRGGRKRAYMQMDGEPWQHPLASNEGATFVEISRNSNPTMMLVTQRK